jgi:hypothetical protein
MAAQHWLAAQVALVVAEDTHGSSAWQQSKQQQ